MYQVRALELQGNWAMDWSLVRVPSGHIAIERIRGCFFHGPVQLGSLIGEVRTLIPARRRIARTTPEYISKMYNVALASSVRLAEQLCSAKKNEYSRASFGTDSSDSISCLGWRLTGLTSDRRFRPDLVAKHNFS